MNAVILADISALVLYGQIKMASEKGQLHTERLQARQPRYNIPSDHWEEHHRKYGAD